MADRTTPEQWLAALGVQLDVRGYSIELNACGLRVTSPEVADCGEVGRAADTITCRTRAEDGGRMWFFTSWGTPLAEADRITDAVVAVMSDLAGRDQR